ncbi:MAG: RNA polymerase-binding protein DksA [Pseudomonadota bacterium]|nr:RNA polymerase-binding protein DksA [Pseudomonadota bacterium]|tara:strand:+ start:110 stop:784 length:675 start_codon:yes stop_codon:yes gene_type:complete
MAPRKVTDKKATEDTKATKSEKKTAAAKTKTTAKETTSESKASKKVSKDAKATTTTSDSTTTGNTNMSDTPAMEIKQTTTESGQKTNLIRGKFPQYNPAADEDYMSAAQLEHFKLILKDWKLELMNEVDRTVDHMKDESANLPDPADRATQEEEFSLELRARDRERKLIKKIDKTLETIENDEYGYCEDCGIEIGLRRLEARPTATLCIDCKTLAEIKEKQFRN